ncbi:hypothetical protein KEM54_001277 [Ascosphaera aggregata]|nr:hypothetical protein KEM54_001277 [Ascosphaera aggregata]
MVVPGKSDQVPNDQPRVWVISAASSLLGAYITARALAQGDLVVKGVHHDPAWGSPSSSSSSTMFDDSNPEDPRLPSFEEYLREKIPVEEVAREERVKEIPCNIRRVDDCQSLIAGAVDVFGRVDILLCCSCHALIGSVEELAVSEHTRMLLRDQFEVNYFGPVSLIRASLPWFRKQGFGHIISVGGITGHLGTPGLGAYCSAGSALEGFCDTIAYEIAPFNIRVTTLQANLEVLVLTHKIQTVPSLPSYQPHVNNAPLFRTVMNSSLSRILPTKKPDGECYDDGVGSIYVPLPDEHIFDLLSETVNALIAIAGHANPPTRHIVGAEGVASVKEKLKAVTEEFEDFIECSVAVDITDDDPKPERKGDITFL